MNDLMKLVSTFVDPVALIMALVLMISLARRANFRVVSRTLMMGVMFSAAVAYTMSDPIVIGDDGVFFDMRSLLVGTAVALLGPWVGMMALVTGMIYRLGLGGAGLSAGLTSMMIAFGAGLVWRNVVARREWGNWKWSAALGLMISVQSVTIFLVPRELWYGLFTGLVPYIVVTNVLGSVLICYLIHGELSFLSTAESLKVAASTDHLTGLLNRRGLQIAYPDLVEPKAPSHGRALLYFDIDKFKSTNDNFGHAVGDAVLKCVVDRVAANLRRNDVFVRLGGDEFAIILPEIEQREARIIAERCHAIVAEEGFRIDFRILPISISMGAVWSRRTFDVEQMLHTADKALYQAKANGRNALVFLSSLDDETGLSQKARDVEAA